MLHTENLWVAFKSAPGTIRQFSSFNMSEFVLRWKQLEERGETKKNEICSKTTPMSLANYVNGVDFR